MITSEFQTRSEMPKHSVLVVDDEAHNLQLVASILSPTYRLLLADSTEKVLKVCVEKKPDLILLDILMPSMSGYDLAVLLKKDERTHFIPIIFLTAKTDEESINQAFQVGGVDYITKPIKAKELLARVKNQINLRTAEKRLRQAIDLVPHRFFAKDSEGNIILANVAAARFYSKTVEDLLGKPEPPLPEGWDYQLITDQEDCLPDELPSQIQNCEEHLIFPDGSKRFFNTHKIPFSFSGSQFPAKLEIAIDITDEKQKQEEIKNLNQQLLKHSQYKDKLLSMIAHDLINPVFNTDMSLSLLLRKSDFLTKEQIIEKLIRVKDNTENTLELLTNLLEWSKAQFKAVTYHPIPLNLFEELLKLELQLQPQLHAKDIKIVFDGEKEEKIEADREMLQAILRNLLSNAFKFSNKGDTVRISAKVIEDRTFISITDQGIGISPDNLKKLQQGNVEHMTTLGTNAEKGSGIGLNLAKEFIERHGGKLLIESEKGKGSTFSFSVPIMQQKSTE